MFSVSWISCNSKYHVTSRAAGWTGCGVISLGNTHFCSFFEVFVSIDSILTVFFHSMFWSKIQSNTFKSICHKYNCAALSESDENSFYHNNIKNVESFQYPLQYFYTKILFFLLTTAIHVLINLIYFYIISPSECYLWLIACYFSLIKYNKT